MKITEILVESQQVDEGPLLNKIGAGIGKVAGTVAKGVGAVAGGVAGLGSAIKKGFQAGKSTVASGGDDETPDTAADSTTTTKPTGGTTAPAPSGETPADKTAPAPKVKTAPAPVGKTASAPTTGEVPAGETPTASGTAYAQVKANIDKLDKKGKQRILATLQKEVGAAKPAAAAKPVPGAAAPAADAEAPADSGAMANMAGQLGKAGASAKPNTMANAPVSRTNTAKPGNPNAAAPAAGVAPEAPAAGTPPKKPNLRTPMALQQKPPAAEAPPADAETPAAETPPVKPAPGATRTTASGEKVLADPVATVGTKRATNIGQATFDKETGKALPGQALNAIRKKAEYGTGALGAARKRNKAGASTKESIEADRRNIMGTSKPTKVREKVSESFSLFRKR